MKLGGNVLFSGKVGKDLFGYFLEEILNLLNVDILMFVWDEKVVIILVFVFL